MGANEKHAATYHGGKYTPGTLDVNNCYRQRWYEQSEAQSDAEFNRWLETVRAEAKAEALADAAFDLPAGMSRKGFYKWLRARANQYKENLS